MCGKIFYFSVFVYFARLDRDCGEIRFARHINTSKYFHYNVFLSNVYLEIDARIIRYQFPVYYYSTNTPLPSLSLFIFDAVTVQRSTEAYGFLPDGAVKCIWSAPRTLYSRLTSISTCSKNVIPFRHSSSASNRTLLVFP